MASRRRTATSYQTYGSVAYAPAYDGSAVRAPRREEEGYAVPRPRRNTRERVLTREQVQVREGMAVSPFAVIGFVAIGIFAALLMLSYTQFAVLSDELISLRGDLTTLQTQNATLSAQYEQVFDMERVQQAVGDTMVRPTGDQIVYLDLSAPDEVTVYSEQGGSALSAFLSATKDAFDSAIEYFR